MSLNILGFIKMYVLCIFVFVIAKIDKCMSFQVCLCPRGQRQRNTYYINVSDVVVVSM